MPSAGKSRPQGGKPVKGGNTAGSAGGATHAAASSSSAKKSPAPEKEAKEIKSMSFDELLAGMAQSAGTAASSATKSKSESASKPGPRHQPGGTTKQSSSSASKPASAVASKQQMKKASSNAADSRKAAAKKSVESESEEDDSDDVEADALMGGSEDGSDAESGSDDDSSSSEGSDGGKPVSVAGHRAQIRALKEKDPEFFEYLRKSDPRLLEFGEEEDDEDEDEDEDEESDDAEEAGEDKEQADDSDAELEADGSADDEDGAAGGSGGKGKGAASASGRGAPPVLTSALATSILASAYKEHDVKGLQRALQAYRACAYMGDRSDVLAQLGLGGGPAAAGGGRKKGAKDRGPIGGRDRGEGRVKAEDTMAQRAPLVLRYSVQSSSVFMRVVTSVLQHSSEELIRHLGSRKGDKPLAKGDKPVLPPKAQLADYPGYKRVANMVKLLVTTTLHLQSQATDATLLNFIGKTLRGYIPLLQTFPKLTKKVLKALLAMWADSDSQAVRLTYFLRLRQAAAQLPYPTLDLVLKGAYHTYVKAAKFMNETSAPSILLMCSCLSELFGVDDAAAYQHAFTYLRQLAVHLRAAITTHSKESLTNVFSWTYVNCLRALTQIITRHGASPDRPLFQLVYPLSQVLLGTLQLASSPRYIPLRLHLLSMLCDITWTSGVYIPIAPLLLGVLSTPAFHAKPKGGSAPGGNPLHLSLMVKVSSSSLETRAVQDAIVNRVFDLLLDAVKANYVSVAFPELCVPVLALLRGFAKETRVGTWRSRARALMDAMSGQAAKITAARGAVAIAPSDKAALAGFMREAREALVRERAAAREAAAAAALKEAEDVAKRTAEEQAKAKKRAQESDDDSEEEEEEEEDSGSEGEDGGAAASSAGGRGKAGAAATSAGHKRKREAEDSDDDSGSDSDESAEGARAAAAAAAAASNSRKKQRTDSGSKPKSKKGLPKTTGSDLVEDLDMDDL